ncbi:outer membrane receptor protein involved in Fe transport [Novosphingobium hassiacum]|uniref:Outer membrane receptor protein involved in Fe transport n=1 Tax=Novosphingobium hassiacum TaxID=173676 RepID=A0A7W5ZWY6_9SPHN|nr:TonB-dependent receptor [Novosphingobium hassiacum]MBB3860024.1 outer membrane receptor protein involved in Fe transport [Novosphingobium hassiacum]
MRRSLLYPAAAMAVVLATPAMAQQAGLQVSVVDAASGEPVAGAQVVFENAAIAVRRTVRSDAQGLARLQALGTGGAWVVSTAASDTYQEAQAQPVQLRANFASSVTLRVKPVGASEITVTAARAVTGINTVNAEISASLSQVELAALPIEGRDVIGSLVRLPNVVASTGFFPEAPVISINGSNGLDTNYLIDGLDNNENFLGGPKFPVPLGFVRAVTVLANSYSVAYGRTPNGVVNFTSPSGTNDLHGEVYALVRPGRPLDAASAFPRRDLSGNPVGESFERYQAGASIGGPIVRDTTFFYANLEYTRDRNVQIVDAPALGTVANVTGHNQSLLGSLRLDHRLSDDWSASLRANVGRVSIDRPGGGLGGGNATFPSAGSDQDRFSTLVAASLRYSGDDWSYDGALQFSRFRWNYAQPKGLAGPQVAIVGPSGLTIGVVGHPGYVFDDLEKTWATTHRLERRAGNHRVSLGVDLLHSNFALLGGGNPDGNFTVQLTPAQLSTLAASGQGVNLGAQDVLALNPTVLNYAVELRPQSFGTDQTQLALYVEDEWNLTPRLTATLGLRWDYDSLTAKGGRGGDTNNFAPRLALNYRPDARSSFRFGAGLFYGKLGYTVISDALQRNTTSAGFLSQLRALQGRGIIPAGVDLADVTFDGNLTVAPPCATVATCPTPAQVQAQRATATLGEGRILNPFGYKSPHSLQLSGGYQFQASDTITLGADVIYSRSHNLVRLRDFNAPAPFRPNVANLTAANIALLRAQPDNASRLALAQSLGLVRSQAAADATRPVALVAGGARQITVSETAGNATYRALVLQLAKSRGEGWYALRLSYTLSKLTNDTDDVNFRASDANTFGADYGPSANDRRHVISAVGTVYPLDGLTLTVAGLFQSGQPVNFVPDAAIFGTQDLNGDGQSFGENYVGNSDRYPGEARNSGRLPWSATVDLGLRYAIPAFAGRLELSADVFNLLNANNQSGFANAATTSNQIQFGECAPFVQRNAAPPRQFQFGAAWKF